jgi:hypothetical protein
MAHRCAAAGTRQQLPWVMMTCWLGRCFVAGYLSPISMENVLKAPFAELWCKPQGEPIEPPFGCFDSCLSE